MEVKIVWKGSVFGKQRESRKAKGEDEDIACSVMKNHRASSVLTVSLRLCLFN
jgi:hypothetical protein